MDQLLSIKDYTIHYVGGTSRTFFHLELFWLFILLLCWSYDLACSFLSLVSCVLRDYSLPRAEQVKKLCD